MDPLPDSVRLAYCYCFRNSSEDGNHDSETQDRRISSVLPQGRSEDAAAPQSRDFQNTRAAVATAALGLLYFKMPETRNASNGKHLL